MSDASRGRRGETRGPGDAAGPGLEQLQSRLEALQGNVERLGAEAATPYQPPISGGLYPPVERPDRHPPPPARPGPPAAAEYPAHTYARPEPPSPPPAAGGDPEDHDAQRHEAAPAATNGHTEDGGATAISPSITMVDAGPFDSLIELREFEEAMAALAAVRDVRVRRVSHGRALIEVGMAGPYAIARELRRLGRPLTIEPGPDGQIVVDLAASEESGEPGAPPDSGSAPPSPEEPG